MEGGLIGKFNRGISHVRSMATKLMNTKPAPNKPVTYNISIKSLWIPSMVFVPHNNNLLYEYSIMENEVTIGQFKEFVNNAAYKITGNNSERLLDKLYNGNPGDPCTYLNANDGKAFAKYLNQRYARAFLIPLKYEWMMAMAKIGDWLPGDNNEWTEQRLSLDLENRTYLQCNKKSINMLSYIECPSDQRSADGAVRLIERVVN
jgi:hypothetical protein